MSSFPSYLTIKSYYDKGYWDIDQVAKAVELNRITTKQYETITGSEYPNNHLATAVEVNSEDTPDYMRSASPVSGGAVLDSTVTDSTASTSATVSGSAVAGTDSAEKA